MRLGGAATRREQSMDRRGRGGGVHALLLEVQCLSERVYTGVCINVYFLFSLVSRTTRSMYAP